MRTLISNRVGLDVQNNCTRLTFSQKGTCNVWNEIRSLRKSSKSTLPKMFDSVQNKPKELKHRIQKTCPARTLSLRANFQTL